MQWAILIGNILLEGMKLWSNERRTHFQNKYHKIISHLNDLENNQYPHYTDASVNIAREERNMFLEAYYKELKDDVNEKTSNNITSN